MPSSGTQPSCVGVQARATRSSGSRRRRVVPVRAGKGSQPVALTRGSRCHRAGRTASTTRVALTATLLGRGQTSCAVGVLPCIRSLESHWLAPLTRQRCAQRCARVRLSAEGSGGLDPLPCRGIRILRRCTCPPSPRLDRALPDTGHKARTQVAAIRKSPKRLEGLRLRRDSQAAADTTNPATRTRRPRETIRYPGPARGIMMSPVSYTHLTLPTNREV